MKLLKIFEFAQKWCYKGFQVACQELTINQICHVAQLSTAGVTNLISGKWTLDFNLFILTSNLKTFALINSKN